MDTFIQQIINGLVLGSVYALVALGYTMVYGIINLINFAHGEVLMVGALTSWTVVVALAGLGLPGWLNCDGWTSRQKRRVEPLRSARTAPLARG